VNFFDPDDRPHSDGSVSAYGLLTHAEHVVYRTVAAMMRAMPLETASNVVGALWRVVAPHLRRQNRTLEHLALAFPEKSLEERKAIARDMWEFLGRTFAEAFHLDKIAADPGRMEVFASEEVKRAVAEQGQAVVVSLHMGNWEVASMSGARLGLHIAGVYQVLKNPLVDRDVARMREPYYPAGLFAKSPETARALMKRLAEGHSLALLADTRDSKGIPIDFFGRTAPTNPFPAAVARARGLPVVAGRILRTGPGRFRADIELVRPVISDDKSADIVATTQAIHALFERWIREVPGQWMWSHRRWG
jgi:KDO2-lipid IV(A) lauroyltransferase